MPVSADAAETDRAILLAAVLLLACLGVLAVQSSSITTRSEGFEPIYLTRHLTNLTLGLVFGWAASRVRPATVSRFAWPVLAATITTLSLVAIPQVGVSAGGATRWLRLPGFQMQPSEWAKLALPLVAARVLSGRARLRDQAGLFAAAATVFVLVLRQPDLGTTLLLAGGFGVSLVLGGWPLRWLVGLAAIGAGGVTVLALRGYQLRRIEGWLATWRDWREAPYQLKQSLICFGEGGWAGVGLGRGWQKLSFLPEGHTDFVVAVVAEEMGVLGVAFLAGCWLTVLLCGVRLLAAFPPQSFRTIAAGTLLIQLVGQAGLNVAVVTGVIPPTGIPHPLLSYGGNSLLVTAGSIGLFAGLSSRPAIAHEALGAHETRDTEPNQ